jgi:hypothetical protein
MHFLMKTTARGCMRGSGSAPDLALGLAGYQSLLGSSHIAMVAALSMVHALLRTAVFISHV